MKTITKIGLRGGAALQVLTLVSAGLTTFSAPAFAQASQASSDEPSSDTIVVTGSIIRRTDAETPSPVTRVTTEELDRRGINTVQDGIQKLASNNGPALTNGFTANGAFAGGASAVSLRGLSTNSTLVLFDGLRAAYYPLADDGSRNFVDLNTIQDDIVENVEVLKDGASSSYGADAIAGVVNIITKREFKGIAGRVEAGVAENGAGGSQRLSLMAGTGDLDDNGFNAYISGFYYHSEAVYNRQLDAPFNSSDQRGIGGHNGQAYGLDANGVLENNGTLTAQGDGNYNLGNLYVRPADALTNTAIAGSRYQLLAGRCINGTPYAPTAADRAPSNNANIPNLVCNEDGVNKYGVVAPEIQRFGGSARITARVGDTSEAYLSVNFQQSTVSYTGGPPTIRGNAPTGIFYPQFSTSSNAAVRAPGSFVLSLPVYVCARSTVGPCTATNGTLNPNNPFATAGQNALIIGGLPTTITSKETRSRVYRAAAGIQGTIFDDVDYKVDFTAMHTDLRRKMDGYVYIQHLLDVIKDGSYNFVNPAANSQDVQDYLTPTNISNASSDLYQGQFTMSKAIADLPGGPLQVAIGGSIYHEAVDAPSANSDINGPTMRYFTLNAFGTKGSRTVSSAFGEIVAPVIDQVELEASGRYDHYSSGQSAFSPKFGIKVKPVRQLLLRGTYSKGFRIPSFGEANALPTTGYVSQVAANIPAAFRAQYGAACATTPASCPTYLTNYSIGQTTLASPNLNPEKSRSFTAGAVFEPIRNLSFTVDYYNIKKTGAITSPSTAPAIAAYYAGQPIPAGFNVIADAPDVNNPTATPRIAFVESTLINSDTIKSEGIDFGANFTHDFGGVKWSSNLEASMLINLSTTFPDGTTEKYVGTLGNFNLTAGSGTFKWHGYWSNTLDFGKLALTGTVNYTSGYDLSAMDQGNEYKDCGLSPGYGDCHVSKYITFDLNTNFKVTDKVNFYVNVINLFDNLPDIDPVTYGAFLYNSVQAGEGVYGRIFRAGARFKF
ncbi:TonB-dependent receptor [Sphingobium sp. PNB]|uniref:TonB-dependent receptor domain-containing protein n=1 Tax=Sphingobium sp. PNB TaxID=863934 RepID=UPI001CA4341E|nr:TonB-dependent receptor [Sphingobium sp. PNB]MCB4863210.1 TonB-dependent receptor [Sphingobium sp. PNB]